MNDAEKRLFALAFSGIAGAFSTLPTWRRVRAQSGWSLYPVELCNTDRLTLLLDWWQSAGDTKFSEQALKLVESPVEGLDAWRDGNDAIQIAVRIKQGDFGELPDRELFLERLEAAILKMLDTSMPIDDLERISDEIDDYKSLFGTDIIEAVSEAIRYQLKSVDDFISDVDSESTLEDHVKSIRKLAERVNIEGAAVDAAVAAVNRQKDRLAEESSSSESSSPILPRRIVDRFDDEQLFGLFGSLLGRM
jgi:hypothetical protein